MHALSERQLLLSATDLSNFLACDQLTLLDRAVAFGEIGKPPKFDDPGLEAIRRRGIEHEQRYLDSLRERGCTIHAMSREAPGTPIGERWMRSAADTVDAMRSGVDVIYQGCLFDGTWLGLPDFLLRVERPSELGEWSYEIADAKLAREAKGGALLQVLLYAELLAGAQGLQPERVHLVLGGPEPRNESFRVGRFAAYFRSIRRRFEDALQTRPGELPVAPEPVEHCQVCNWRLRCDRERRDVDHLSLVAGIRRIERRGLEERGIGTVETLARTEIPLRPRLEGVSDAALERSREQARVQSEGRRQSRPVHELLLPVIPEQGLAMLPEPSAGDIFFDLEGDPYALTDGIEYLFGFVDRQGTPTSWWALDRPREKVVFERFIDFVIARLKQYPGMHVYHYAPYEPTAIKRLMGRHATREEEVDRLLRGKVFVDLYRAVRQGVRASVESYSIKKLEPFYGYRREVDLRNASSALANFEAWLQMGGGVAGEDGLLAAIEGYNRDDCVSTLRLAQWLESLRGDLERSSGGPVPRPAPPDPEPPPGVAEEIDEITRLVSQLESGVATDPAARTEEEHARWLLAQLLGYHRREHKSMWWEYYRRIALADDELIEDRATLGGLSYQGVVDTVKRSEVHRYRFPAQDYEVRRDGDARDPRTGKAAGDVVDVDDVACTIDLKRGRARQVPHPGALVPLEYIDDGVMRKSLQALAREVLAEGLSAADPATASITLLLRRVPRAGQGAGESLVGPDESTLDAARRLVNQLDRTVLAIQGPPGAGKSYTAARMIVSAIVAGKRVGVTATSHKVISNLLEKTCKAAREEGLVIAGLQKADNEDACPSAEIEATNDYTRIRSALDDRSANVVGGTAWMWSRDDMRSSVDVLFVDEAGQFSLANALAIASATSSLVLVGDPLQLQQPQKGVHPPGVEVSALEHLLGDTVTFPADRGLFLDRTWRLHPDICAFTSATFYEGRLNSRDGLERQAIRTGRLGGSGLRLIAVDHLGRQSECPEEVAVVTSLIADSLDGGTWIDRDGVEARLQTGDILVVAPYNAQVLALQEAVPGGVRVGTVDRFQGQEAPLVIYSMTSSTAEDAPRGMDFLYNPNRLNVATSRARCLVVVVASSRLFVPECRSPAQMRLANSFCALAERANPVG